MNQPINPHDVLIPATRFKIWLQKLFEGIFYRGPEFHISLIFGGPIFFQTLRTACQVDLFGLLTKSPGLTAEEIAERLHLDLYPTRVLLLTCITLKLLKKSGQRHSCTRLCKPLVKDNPASIIPALEWMHHIVYPSFFHYLEAITRKEAAGLRVFQGEEDNLYARLSHDPKLEQIFHEAMARRSQATNMRFTELVDFGKFDRVLDVGGGNGENIIRIAGRYPTVRGTVVDFPTVAARAQQRFKEQGIENRLFAVGANILEEPLPTGHDCILFCHFTPIFSEAFNLDFMRRAFAALEPGGMVCVFAPFMDDDESGPPISAILSPYFLCTVNGQGRHYSMKETISWLEQAGFAKIATGTLPRNEGVVLGVKP